MSGHPSDTKPGNQFRRTDWLTTALAGYIVLWCGCFLLLGTIIVHAAVLQNRTMLPARQLVRALDLMTLALVPSGRAYRWPEIMVRGVDTRMTPDLPVQQPDPISLLLCPPQKQNKPFLSQ